MTSSMESAAASFEGDETPASHDAPKSGRNLPVAIATGLALAAVLILTLFWALLPFTILVTTAILVGLAELYHVLAKQRGLSPATSLGYAGAFILLFGTAWRGPVAISFGIVAVTLTAFLWYLVDPARERITENIGATLFGVVYLPLLAAHVIAMAKLQHGPALTIVFMGATVFYDVGAYACGSFFGKHRIAPSISPSKSWEGAAGGTVIVFVLALTIGRLFHGFDIASVAGLAAIVVVLAPLGDFAESLVKRDLGVKDMGGLLPGHGGMLDRIDALLFTAPFAYWFLRLATQ
ncbi:MAG: phosphatidate cytidylyltransferase [Actinomycetota bacterium]|nr:phosphatidate cytidylyltransferase [Actinomycetota bacterium]